jgi:hypothetical protein
VSQRTGSMSLFSTAITQWRFLSSLSFIYNVTECVTENLYKMKCKCYLHETPNTLNKDRFDSNTDCYGFLYYMSEIGYGFGHILLFVVLAILAIYQIVIKIRVRKLWLGYMNKRESSTFTFDSLSNEKSSKDVYLRFLGSVSLWFDYVTSCGILVVSVGK